MFIYDRLGTSTLQFSDNLVKKNIFLLHIICRNFISLNRNLFSLTLHCIVITQSFCINKTIYIMHSYNTGKICLTELHFLSVQISAEMVHIFHTISKCHLIIIQSSAWEDIYYQSKNEIASCFLFTVLFKTLLVLAVLNAFKLVCLWVTNSCSHCRLYER